MTGPLVVVFTAHGQPEAEMIKMLLNSEGVPAMAFQESYGKTLGLTFGKLGQADIMVPVEYEKKARELIESIEKDNLE